MQEEGYKAIESKYGVPQHKLQAYFHYLPTYWLLHVHFVHVDGMQVDAREHVPLEVVIQNLEITGEYYSKCTMTYKVGHKHDLCKVLMKEGILQEYVAPSNDTEWEDVNDKTDEQSTNTTQQEQQHNVE